MKLSNCTTKYELELKNTEIESINLEELLNLQRDIIKNFQFKVLENKQIMTEALLQITEELKYRVGTPR